MPIMDFMISEDLYKEMRKICDISRDKDPNSIFKDIPYSDERAKILFQLGLEIIKNDLKVRGLLK